MASNTKARSDELAKAAAEVLTASGADVTDAVPIAPMVETMTSLTGCHADTARRHLARAVRRARFATLSDDTQFAINNWGGAREGAGRGHTKPV